MGSALNQDYSNFEVIIVDDASTDNTVKIIKKFKNKKIHLTINKKNSGPGLTRNIAIKKAKGKLILLLDSDTVVSEDWVSKHVNEHKNVDMVGGAIFGIHKTISGEADAICSHFTSIPNSKRRYLKKFHLPTNNLSIKKEVFDKIGYFKKELISGEDAEFCNRALKNNIKILFAPNILVYHLDRDGFKNYMKHQFSWGKYVIDTRKNTKIEYNWLMPHNFLISLFYIVPLAVLHTVWLVKQWIKYKPKVILYVPLLFIGKMAQTISISKSFLDSKN